MKLTGTGRAGFSLIEVLVALVILAICLATASRAISGWMNVSQRQDETLRAQLCADNALNTLRLARQMPGTGSSSQVCVQAGQSLDVRLQVTPTPNPAFFRVDAQVFSLQQPVLRVTALLGRY
jgi:general secretion pathway protein I